jgi:glycosyltransferase involved in cell wall biosynthesis
MLVGIFGRHPIPQPGFMGVMSLFEAIYLSRQGHEVELLLPFPDPAALAGFLGTHGLSGLDRLEQYNGCFAVRALFAGEALERRYDAIIYQSYDAADFVTHFPALRQAARILTKNFPKFVPSARHAFHETVVSSFRTFDVVACALRDDVVEMQTNARFWDRHGAQVAYVPRGADPVMLHPGRKPGGRPTIGLEIPFTADGRAAIGFYVEPIRRLREQVPGLRVLTLGAEPHPEIESEHVPFGRFDTIYEEFFNEVWLYLIMDYALSPVHVTAPVQRLHPGSGPGDGSASRLGGGSGGWSARAIYEVQNIEAQMAGAVIVGHPRNTIPELLQPGATALHFRNYDDAAALTALMRAGIDDFAAMSRCARRWAVENFTWEHCMALWSDALSQAVPLVERDA